MDKITKAYLLIFLSMVLGSTGPSTFLLIAKSIDCGVGVMYFLLFGGIVLLLMCYFIDTESWKNGEIKEAINQKAVISILVAGVAVALMYLGYVKSMEMESITEGVLIIRISPLISIILARLILKEKVRTWIGLIFAVAICLGGIFIIRDMKNINLNNFFTPFIIMALSTAFFSSLSSVMARNAQAVSTNKIGEDKKGLPNLFITGSEMLVGFFFLLLWNIVNQVNINLPDLRQFLFLFYLGVITVGIASYLYLKAYSLANNYSRFVIMDYFFPIFTAINAYIINGERGLNYGRLFVGFVFISFGTWIANKCILQKK
ncbi:MAG: DMT family transporter [Candidatus Magasanikbacteria bacterium]|nr:DMT family transporter [Candidatus Magasanikbacteria bacterium]